MSTRLSNDRPLVIIGVGSIGSRHVRNLKTLGYKNIILCRSGKGKSWGKEFSGLSIKYAFEDALSTQPLGVIISNPTSLHLPMAIEAAKAKCHIFLEKPISDTLDGIGELKKVVRRYNLCVLVGYQFRFHPALQEIKKWIDSGAIGRVISVQCYWGEYLPAWHAGEDYRKGYSAKAELGGGVILTLSHPFDYLRWLIGEVVSVSAMVDRLSDLEINVEDTAGIILRFAGGAIGSIYLDYLQQPASHWLTITGKKGMIRWDNTGGIARIFNPEAKKWESFSPPAEFERNTMFIEEMRNFLNCASGREKPRCALDDGIRALEIALAVKRSAVEKKEIKLN